MSFSPRGFVLGRCLLRFYGLQWATAVCPIAYFLLRLWVWQMALHQANPNAQPAEIFTVQRRVDSSHSRRSRSRAFLLGAQGLQPHETHCSSGTIQGKVFLFRGCGSQGVTHRTMVFAMLNHSLTQQDYTQHPVAGFGGVLRSLSSASGPQTEPDEYKPLGAHTQLEGKGQRLQRL